MVPDLPEQLGAPTEGVSYYVGTLVEVHSPLIRTGHGKLRYFRPRIMTA